VTIHYHGTPITPGSVLEALSGRNFCVSFAAPHQVARCHELGQSVMLDNGAFSHWKIGKPPDWDGYAEWAERWLDHKTTWAVIPDVIDGDEADNDLLIAKWPRSLYPQSAPVWHMHESLDRLSYLCSAWGKVCIGSSAEYATVGSSGWHRRVEAAMNRVCGEGPAPTWLHMLRGMATVEQAYPFASVDSTDIARNHNRNMNSAAAKAIRARKMAERWDGIQTPARWIVRDQLCLTEAR
jgi:hypothetical protein